MSAPGQLPFVSVVIPARNEESNIRTCIEALHRLDYPKDRLEIIIADGMSGDRTREIAESLGAIVVENPGLYVADGRHVGFEHSKGEFVAFSDADCVVDRGWIRDALKYFDDPTVGAVSGPTLVPPNETRFGRGAAWAFSLAVAGGASCQADTITRAREVRDMPGGNCICRREVIEQVMPLATGLVASEDVEMNWRIRKNGWRLLQVPEFRVWHYKRPTPKRLARQIYRFGVTRCQCGKISREMLGFWHWAMAAWMPLAVVLVAILAVWTPKALLAFAGAAVVGLVGLFVAAWIGTRSFVAALNAVFAFLILLMAWPVGFLHEVLFPARYFREHSVHRRRT
ncbi:MAG: glycosyltransferase [Verrucomicrobia bacterium]|nr:glycosyltransferase [Verrucomicrobiota bacterium]